MKTASNVSEKSLFLIFFDFELIRAFSGEFGDIWCKIIDFSHNLLLRVPEKRPFFEQNAPTVGGFPKNLVVKMD